MILTGSSEQTSKYTKEVGAIQKGADYVRAFALGFKIAVSDIDIPYTVAISDPPGGRTLLLSFEWMTSTLIASKSRMSKPSTVITSLAQ